MQCMNLKCPNLLTIFDMKTSDSGDPFVVMEYVAGPSLAGVLEQHTSGVADARGSSVAQGVGRGGRLSARPRDRPSRLEAGQSVHGGRNRQDRRLWAGQAHHSPARGPSTPKASVHAITWPPRSVRANTQTDRQFYAMGVILYEMLTGRVPFDGETVNEVLMKHLTARPDVSAARAVQTIVAKALAKDPNQRTSSLYDLLPPEDASARPEVRIIGDGKAGPRARGGQDGARGRCHAYRGRGADLLHRAGYSPRPGQDRRVSRAARANWDACGAPGRYQAPAAPALATPADPGSRSPRANGTARRRVVRSAGRQTTPTRASPDRPRSHPVYLAAASASPSWPDRCFGPRRCWHCSPCQPLHSWGSILRRSPRNSHICSGWRQLLGTWTACDSSESDRRPGKLDGTNRRLIALAGGLFVGTVGAALATPCKLDFTQPVA